MTTQRGAEHDRIFANSVAEIDRRIPSRQVTWMGPLLIVSARTVLLLLFQVLTAAVLSLGHTPHAWTAAGKWWTVYKNLVDLGYSPRAVVINVCAKSAKIRQSRASFASASVERATLVRKPMWYNDGAVQAADGYFRILGRVDDVINVAGHRLGTKELESAIDLQEIEEESMTLDVIGHYSRPDIFQLELVPSKRV